MSIVLGLIDCASTDPVIQSNQRPHLYMFFSDPVAICVTSVWTSGYGCFLHTAWYHVH